MEGEYLEAPLASRALAAAEAIAAAAGHPQQTLPDSLTTWVREHPLSADKELITTARAAVTRVLVDSELRDLWFEGDEGPKWEAEVTSLLGRLTV
jgi:hypothetical protein